MTASHIAILTKEDAYDWLDNGARLIRRCFGILENYKHSGITRQDALENNARYQAAVKRMKYVLSDDVLSGLNRATFAPVIRQSSLDMTQEDETEVQISPTYSTEQKKGEVNG